MQYLISCGRYQRKRGESEGEGEGVHDYLRPNKQNGTGDNTDHNGHTKNEIEGHEGQGCQGQLHSCGHCSQTIIVYMVGCSRCDVVAQRTRQSQKRQREKRGMRKRRHHSTLGLQVWGPMAVKQGFPVAPSGSQWLPMVNGAQ